MNVVANVCPGDGRCTRGRLVAIRKSSWTRGVSQVTHTLTKRGASQAKRNFFHTRTSGRHTPSCAKRGAAPSRARDETLRTRRSSSNGSKTPGAGPRLLSREDSIWTDNQFQIAPVRAIHITRRILRQGWHSCNFDSVEKSRAQWSPGAVK